MCECVCICLCQNTMPTSHTEHTVTDTASEPTPMATHGLHYISALKAYLGLLCRRNERSDSVQGQAGARGSSGG